MSAQPPRKMPAEDIPEFIRGKHRLSPAVQKIVDDNRRQHDEQSEVFRAVARDIIENAQKQLAMALKLNLDAFAQVPDDVLDHLFATSRTAKALEEVPGTKITVSFASEVTVNGIRVPDEDTE